MQHNKYIFILGCLTSELDQLKATNLYLSHQISLPERYRVIQEDEETIFEAQQKLKLQIIQYEQAIAEFTECKLLLLTGE